MAEGRRAGEKRRGSRQGQKKKKNTGWQGIGGQRKKAREIRRGIRKEKVSWGRRDSAGSGSETKGRKASWEIVVEVLERDGVNENLCGQRLKGDNKGAVVIGYFGAKGRGTGTRWFQRWVGVGGRTVAVA